MNQRDLHRSVARSTGESISEIAHRGFSLADPITVNHDPEPIPEDAFLDWDRFALEQNLAILEQPVASLIGHI
jgi:hypothetical protein